MGAPRGKPLLSRPSVDEGAYTPRPVDNGQIELAQVGHFGVDQHFDLGTADNGGVTMVRVTLYRGRDPTVPHDPDNAQGHEVLAFVSAPLWFIPPKGARVIVMRPAGYGGWYITSVIGPNPSIQFNDKRAILDFGPDMSVTIKAKSVTLSDYHNRFAHIGPDGGFKVGDASGNGLQLKNNQWLMYTVKGSPATAVTTFKMNNADGVEIMVKDAKMAAMALTPSGQAQVAGEVFNAYCPQGYLGAGVAGGGSPLTFIGIGGPAVSTTWKVQA